MWPQHVVERPSSPTGTCTSAWPAKPIKNRPIRSAEPRGQCRFAAAPLFGGVILIISRHQEAPSAAPEGQGENSPGQRSAATAALGNRPTNANPSFLGLPCRRCRVGTEDQEKRGIFFIAPLPRAALRSPWAIIFRPCGAWIGGGVSIGEQDWLAAVEVMLLGKSESGLCLGQVNVWLLKTIAATAARPRPTRSTAMPARPRRGASQRTSASPARRPRVIVGGCSSSNKVSGRRHASRSAATRCWIASAAVYSTIPRACQAPRFIRHI